MLTSNLCHNRRRNCKEIVNLEKIVPYEKFFKKGKV